MFAQDQPIIARIASETPEGLASVMKLAILSAQSPFAKLDKAMKEARTREWGNHGAANVTATKRLGCDWADENARRLLGLFRAWKKLDLHISTPSVMMELMCCPGLGMVKAGFVTQMIWGTGGCLDTHNLVRLGVDPRIVVPGKWNTLSRWTRLYRYLRLCREFGGAEGLWNDWCVWLCQREPERWPDPAEVSAWHVELIDGMPY